MKRNPTVEALIPELAEFADALEEFERAYGLEPKVTYEQDQTCPMCGTRQIACVTDPKAPSSIMAVCIKCSTSDSPSQYPDTGWHL